MPPLIEYGAQGPYVIVSSQEGELHLVPDSAEWFEWLAKQVERHVPGKTSLQLGAAEAYDDWIP